MLIKIENLGPVSSFSFDLDQSFHMIVGGNNVGKSYAMTAVYVVIKSLLNFSSQFKLLLYMSEGEFESSANHILQDIKGTDEVDITSSVREDMSKLIENYLAGDLTSSLEGSFGSIQNLDNVYTGKPFQIGIESDPISFWLEHVNDGLVVTTVHLGRSVYLRSVNQNRKPTSKENHSFVYNNKKNKDHFVESYPSFVVLYFGEMLTQLTDRVRSVHYLPASRSGLYQALTAFGAIMAELSKSRSFLRRKIEIPGIPEHLSDYFIKLTEISKGSRRRFDPTKVEDVAQKIESEILDGQVDFDVSTKKITYTPKGTSLILDLTSTSSMVSELAPIVSYIRYVLTERSAVRSARMRDSRRQGVGKNPTLVIIEEPEAHLHPSVQVQLVEIFSDLISRDVKVAITSHSNYIFNKVNNLVLSESLDYRGIQASLFSREGSCGQSTKLHIDDLGIADRNFAETTDALLDEQEEAIEKRNFQVKK